MNPKNPYFPSDATHSRGAEFENQNRRAENSTSLARQIQNEDFFLSERDVARRQGRSVRTLQNQRVSGGGIPYLKLGRSVRYRLSDVLVWEEARRRCSTSEGRSNV